MPGQLKILTLALGVAASGACQAPDMAQQALVKGSITYRERIALPPSAIAQVLLNDTSASDALSRRSPFGRTGSAPSPPLSTCPTTRPGSSMTGTMPCRRESWTATGYCSSPINPILC